MNRRLLPWHPAPHLTESLVGYVLRLSEGNGLLTPWSIYNLAGMKQNEIRTSGIKLEKLAAIVNRPAAELDHIGFSAPADQPRWARLLGNSMVPTDLSINAPGLCPRCVAEKGFIEAHWHLTLMVGCPVHECRLAACCPKCGKRPRLFRHGLLECGCGGNLMECELGSMPKEDAALLDIIRRKVLGVSVDPGNPFSLPQDQLMAMNLRSMLMVVRTLGKHRLTADGIPTLKDECAILSASARVLVDWPKNFIELLMHIGDRFKANGKGGVRKQFESIYHALFKSRAIKPREQTDFLRVAFLEFAMNHWDRGFVDGKLLKRVRGSIEGRFITQSAFASKAGIARATASRWLKDEKIPSRQVQCGKSMRIIVDFSQNTIPHTSPGKTYWERDAAKRMGLSIGVLRALKDCGIFEFNHLLPTRGGYHELDMSAFTAKLLAQAPPLGIAISCSDGAICLKTIMNGHHDSPKTKVEIIRALLTGTLAMVGNTDGSIAGLLLDRRSYRQFVIEARSRAANGMILPDDVEKLLRCDASTVPGLVQLGLLSGVKTPTGFRITTESVEAFSSVYVSMAAIASEIGTTSSRGLMRLCKENGIDLLLVPSRGQGCQQPFIGVSDRLRLMSLRLNADVPDHGSETDGRPDECEGLQSQGCQEPD